MKQSTTTDLTPEQIHQIGLDQVKQDEEQLLAIAHKLGFADIKALQNAAANNPKLFPTSKEQLLDAYRGYLDQMRPKLPQLFGRLPKAPLVVMPVPDYAKRTRRRLTTNTAPRTAPGPARYSSTLINLKRGPSTQR